MHLFRSEEHARRSSGFRAEHADGLLTLAELVRIMSTPFMRERLNGHYVSSAAGYRPEFLARVREVTSNRAFWDPTPR